METSKKNTHPQTLPKFVLSALEQSPGKELFHYHHNDVHTSLTTDEASHMIRQGALGLKELGIARGEYVGIIMKSSPHWLLSEQMIQSIGAVSVGIYDNITFKSLEHYIQETELDTVFVDEESCYELLQSFQTKLKRLIVKDDLFEHIQTDTKLDNVELISWSQLLASGKEQESRHPTRFQEELEKLSPTEVSAIIYTSGSANLPQGVVLTHQDFIYQVTSNKKRFSALKKEDSAISILPIAHSFERIVIYLYVSIGIKIHFLSDPQKLIQIIGHVQPNILTAVPRLLERVHEGMLKKANLKPVGLRHLARAAIKRAAEQEPERESLSPKGFLDNLYERLVYKKLRLALGGNLKFIISGGAPLEAETLRFFFSIGVPVYEGYGLTETAPVISCNSEDYFKPYSVGKILAGIQTKISDEGELIVHTPSLMKEYLKNAQKTNEAIKTDSLGVRWLHTGDKVRIEDGYIFIEGRIKDFFKTSTGKYVNPILSEKLLSRHNLVNSALVVGERRKFVSALIFVDEAELEKMGNSHEQVEVALQKWVEHINQELEEWERIKKFKVIWKLLTIKENELTPKMNIKRGELEKKFATTLDALYN